jgi:hypothetical protein
MVKLNANGLVCTFESASLPISALETEPMERRPLVTWSALVALAAALVRPGAAGAQAPGTQLDLIAPSPAPGGSTLLLVGTFHLAYPGRDVHKATVRVDVLSAERQREIAEVVERLAAFRPTRIAVEVMPARQAALDSTYQAYLAGVHTLTANETEQIGFRLARRLGLPRLYAVDADPSPAFNGIFEAMEAREPALDTVDGGWQRQFRQWYSRDDSLAADHTVRETLFYLNSEDHIRRDHGGYSVGWFKLEGEDGFLGADFRAAWYDRNLRIFRNLQRLGASADDRTLLIIGAGHLPILRFVAGTSPEFRLEDATRYLGPPR